MRDLLTDLIEDDQKDASIFQPASEEERVQRDEEQIGNMEESDKDFEVEVVFRDSDSMPAGYKDLDMEYDQDVEDGPENYDALIRTEISLDAAPDDDRVLQTLAIEGTEKLKKVLGVLYADREAVLEVDVRLFQAMQMTDQPVASWEGWDEIRSQFGLTESLLTTALREADSPFQPADSGEIKARKKERLQGVEDLELVWRVDVTVKAHPEQGWEETGDDYIYADGQVFVIPDALNVSGSSYVESDLRASFARVVSEDLTSGAFNIILEGPSEDHLKWILSAYSEFPDEITDIQVQAYDVDLEEVLDQWDGVSEIRDKFGVDIGGGHGEG